MKKPSEAQKDQYDSVIEKEKTHKQWDKHAVCVGLLVAIVVTNVLRGNKSFPSIVGIPRCSILDWLILGLFFGFCFVLSYLSVKKVQRE